MKRQVIDDTGIGTPEASLASSNLDGCENYAASTDVTRWAFNVGAWNPPREIFDNLLTYVQPEERARIRRFHFPRDAQLSLVGRLMARSYLTARLKVPWDAVQIGRTPENKPYLYSPNADCPSPLDGAHVTFNISHQGNWTVFVALDATSSCSVGVDVMRIEPSRIHGESTDTFLECFRSQFTLREWTYITAVTVDRRRLERFYRLWCLKESYVKAVGLGLGIDLRSVEFVIREPLDIKDQETGPPITSTLLFVPPIEEGHPIGDTTSCEPELCVFEESFLDENHCVAVCLACNAEKEKWQLKLPTVARFKKIDSVDQLVHQARPLS